MLLLIAGLFGLDWTTHQLIQSGWLVDDKDADACLVLTAMRTAIIAWALGLYIYIHTWMRTRRTHVTPQALCLRGYTWGLSEETLNDLFAELTAYLDDHPEIRFIVWDGDLRQPGSFANLIERALQERPTLRYIAFKKQSSAYKLRKGFEKDNGHGARMRGFTNYQSIDIVPHNKRTRRWTPTSQLTVVTFVDNVLMQNDTSEYEALTYAGLTFLRQTMGLGCVATMTMGEGPVVRSEYDRMHNGKIEVDRSGRRLFPAIEWVQCAVPHRT